MRNKEYLYLFFLCILVFSIIGLIIGNFVIGAIIILSVIATICKFIGDKIMKKITKNGKFN